VAEAVLRGPHAKAILLVGAHQTVHDGQGRVAQEQLRDGCGRCDGRRWLRRQRRRRTRTGRLHRRSAHEPAQGSQAQHGPRAIRTRRLHRRSFGRRQHGHASPVHGCHQTARGSSDPRRGRTSDRWTTFGPSLRQTGHALHRGHSV